MGPTLLHVLCQPLYPIKDERYPTVHRLWHLFCKRDIDFFCSAILRLVSRRYTHIQSSLGLNAEEIERISL